MNFVFEVVKREYVDTAFGQQWILWIVLHQKKNAESFSVSKETFDACRTGTILMLARREHDGTLKAV